MPQPTARRVTVHTDLPGNSFSDDFRSIQANANRKQSTPLKNSADKHSGQFTQIRPSCPNGGNLSQATSGYSLRRLGMNTLSKVASLGPRTQYPTKNLDHNPSLSKRGSSKPNATRGLGSATSYEDLMATLGRYHTVFLVDDSASMSQKNLWSETATALQAITQKALQYDSDGIDIYFLNTTTHARGIRAVHEVDNLFRSVQPLGKSTPIELRVEHLVGQYLGSLEHGRAHGFGLPKPLNLIVLTDGVADDPDSLAIVISNAAERLDQQRFPLNQLGIQFIQIGRDALASAFLQNLDNDLQSQPGSKRDIVDTVPYKGRVTGDFILKSLLGGINR
ncbi:hypothetical protein CROQUDRAFT_652000, partial [Cronartium quercuum f. sp. fusiforme G11]